MKKDLIKKDQKESFDALRRQEEHAARIQRQALRNHKISEHAKDEDHEKDEDHAKDEAKDAARRLEEHKDALREQEEDGQPWHRKGAPPLLSLDGKKFLLDGTPLQLHVMDLDVKLMDNLVEFIAKMKKSGKDPWVEENQFATNAQLTGRGPNMAKYKPGVDTIHFFFSNRLGTKTFQFPWYKKFESVIRPIVDPILESFGVDNTYINRLQLAKMNPGAQIVQHKDLGPWVMKSHRTHIVVTVVPEVTFVSTCDIAFKGMPKEDTEWCPVRLRKGEVFELNNNVFHKANNPSKDGERIHLILDWGEIKHDNLEELPMGAECDYRKLSKGTCVK